MICVLTNHDYRSIPVCIKRLKKNKTETFDIIAYNYYKEKCQEQNLYEVSFNSFLKLKTLENLNKVHNGVIKNYNLKDLPPNLFL